MESISLQISETLKAGGTRARLSVMLPLQFSIVHLPTKKSKPHLLSRVPSISRHVHPPCLVAAANNAIVTEETFNGVVNGRATEPLVLPAGLRRELMPNHLAVVMDGNRRWARMRGLPVQSGYEEGFRAFRGLVKRCCQWGIRVLTVFAFSSDNWFRPTVEVDFLMGLLERALKNELETFVREDIRISLIGDSSKLPRPLIDMITNAEKETMNNSRLHLVVAINYSGQYDVVQACRRISEKVKDGLIEPGDIDEFLVEQELETRCTEFPSPDLLIRTSGELRISNFLLWQLAYTELFFAQSCWPDFGETELLEALCSFQERQRRYGGQII